MSYVSNYEASTALCSSLRKKNEQFEQWEKEALSTLPGNHSSIGFLLVWIFYSFFMIFVAFFFFFGFIISPFFVV